LSKVAQLKIQLDSAEALVFTRVAELAIAVRTESDFNDLVINHVALLIPHGTLLAVLGEFTFEHLTIRHCILVRYPEWAFAQIPKAINVRERPVIKRWIKTTDPVIVDVEHDAALLSERELFEIQAFGLGRIAVHGVPDLSYHMGSYFSFAQVNPDMDRAVLSQRLAMICPLLHIALTRVFRQAKGAEMAAYDLTAIERDLLMWLAAGRSNQEMAQLRHRSLSTVRNQLEKLYAKLGVSTRAEAVALVLMRVRHLPE
jgi:DNA-binding CsgD family transcriptional regulator